MDSLLHLGSLVSVEHYRHKGMLGIVVETFPPRASGGYVKLLTPRGMLHFFNAELKVLLA